MYVGIEIQIKILWKVHTLRNYTRNILESFWALVKHHLLGIYEQCGLLLLYLSLMSITIQINVQRIT